VAANGVAKVKRMECPSCQHSLKQYRYRGLLVDICRKCSGIWFDPGEMKTYIEFLQKDGTEIPFARIDLDRRVMTETRVREAGKLCPRCRQAMHKFNYAYNSNIILDRCPQCGGMWADGGEILQVASYIKGNPRLDKLGRSVVEHSKEMQMIKDLASFGSDLSANAGWLYFPRIILPVGDDMETGAFPVMVLTLIVLNLAVLFYQSFYVMDPDSFVRAWGLIPAHVRTGEGLYTLVSSLFLHGNAVHLAVNMFFLWIFGDNVEDGMGHVPFLAFYILFGIAGGALHILANPFMNIPAIGSSGAVAGVMGAYFVLYPQAKLKTFIINRVIDVPALYYIGAWIFLQGVFAIVYFSGGMTGGLAWFGHIGGFISGVIMTWLLKRAKGKRISSVQ